MADRKNRLALTTVETVAAFTKTDFDAFHTRIVQGAWVHQSSPKVQCTNAMCTDVRARLPR